MDAHSWPIVSPSTSNTAGGPQRGWSPTIFARTRLASTPTICGNCGTGRTCDAPTFATMRNRSGVERYGGKPIVVAEPTRRPTCWVVSEIPWFYVDDAFADSKPVMKLDRALRNEAIGLWVRCGAWSAKEETDGRVPLETVRQFGGTPRLIRALHDQAGLWVENSPESWRDSREILFGNWGKWQKTSAELLAKRRDDAERQRNRRRKGRNALTSLDELDADDSANKPTDTEDEMSRCDTIRDSHVTSRARAQTRPDPTLSSYLGGECPVGEPDGLPPRFCEEHPYGTTRGCGACRDARLRREAAEADLARDELDAKRRQRDAATNCPICQGTNWIPDTEPAVRCNHA